MEIFVPVFVFIIIISGGIAFIRWYQKKNEAKFRLKESNTLKFLADNGFIVSRTVGHFDRFNATGSYYLYIDDVNKKWLITPPMGDVIGKIRNYDDMIAFDFFDNEDETWIKKLSDKSEIIGKVVLGAVGVVAGYFIGDLLGNWRGGIIGAIGGGIGLTKLARLLNGNPQGTTGAYGLVLKTKDSDADNTCLIFDFLLIDGKTAGKAMGAPRLARHIKLFKDDIKTISEIVEVLEYIHKHNLAIS